MSQIYNEFLKLTSDVHDTHTEALLSMKVSESERALGPLALKIKAAIAGAIPKGFWVDLSEEELQNNLTEILTVLDGSMSTRDKFYRRSEHAAQLALQLIETRNIPSTAKVKAFRDALSVILDGRAGFEIGKHLEVILDNVQLVSSSFRDPLAQKIENILSNVSMYTREARLILTHPNLSILISARFSLRNKLREKINEWQMAEGELRTELREDLVTLCNRPNTTEVFGPNFPPDSVVRFAIGELATEETGIESPVTKANLSLLFNKNIPLSKFAGDISKITAMVLDSDKGTPSVIPVFVHLLNRVEFMIPGNLYAPLKATVSGYSGSSTDLWNAIIRLFLWESPTLEAIGVFEDEISTLDIKTFSELYTLTENNQWADKRASLMLQATRKKWEKSVATFASADSRDVLLYCITLDRAIKEEEITTLFENISTSNDTPTLEIWKLGLELLFQKMSSASREKALDQLFEMMADSKSTLEKREWLYLILNKLVSLQGDEIKRSYSDRQIKLVVSGDQGIRDFAAQRLPDIQERYGEDAIAAMAPSLVTQLLDSRELLNHRMPLESFTNYYPLVPALSWSKFAERLRVDINRTDISNAEKIYMLNAGRYIRLASENESQALANLLWDVEANNTDHEIRVAASELVEQLTRNRIIPNRPKPDHAVEDA